MFYLSIFALVLCSQIPTCTTKVPPMMIRKIGLRVMPSNTFLSPCTLRELISLKSCNITNVLKTRLEWVVGLQRVVSKYPSSMSNKSSATKTRTNRTMNWKMACPIIFLIMVREIRGFVRPYGLRVNKSSVGGSVARASEANESIIRFTHKS